MTTGRNCRPRQGSHGPVSRRRCRIATRRQTGVWLNAPTRGAERTSESGKEGSMSEEILLSRPLSTTCCRSGRAGAGTGCSRRSWST